MAFTSVDAPHPVEAALGPGSEGCTELFLFSRPLTFGDRRQMMPNEAPETKKKQVFCSLSVLLLNPPAQKRRVTFRLIRKQPVEEQKKLRSTSMQHKALYVFTSWAHACSSASSSCHSDAFRAKEGRAFTCEKAAALQSLVESSQFHAHKGRQTQTVSVLLFRSACLPLLQRHLAGNLY